MNLVLRTLQKSLNLLSKCHLEVQLDFWTSGVSSQIQHSSDDRDPLMMQNVLHTLIDHIRVVSDFRQIPRRSVLKFSFSWSTAAFLQVSSLLEE